jgi:hypothetical protein
VSVLLPLSTNFQLYRGYRSVCRDVIVENGVNGRCFFVKLTFMDLAFPNLIKIRSLYTSSPWLICHVVTYQYRCLSPLTLWVRITLMIFIRLGKAKSINVSFTKKHLPLTPFSTIFQLYSGKLSLQWKTMEIFHFLPTRQVNSQALWHHGKHSYKKNFNKFLKKYL